MARVLLVTPNLPPSPEPESLLGWRLANTLAESQHEVKILTGPHPYQDFPQFHNRVEVLQIFKRWSLLEMPRLFPLWLQWRPEVLHLLPPPRPSSLWYSLPMTPGAFPMLPRPKVIASFWRLPERGWVFQSAALDAVTVANENQRHRLTSQPGRQPWVETLRLFDGRRPFAFTERLLPSDFNPYVFVPGPLTEHEDPELPLRLAIQVLPTRPHWHFVIGGQMDDLGFKKAREWWNQLGAHGIVDRLFFTGPVEVMQITDLIKEADVLLTASLKLESFQTSLALQAGHTYARPIVMNTAQATYDSYTWDHEHSACVCSRPFSEMTAQLELVMDNQVMRQRLHENLLRTSHEMTDHAVNVLSRLYLATGPASI